MILFEITLPYDNKNPIEGYWILKHWGRVDIDLKTIPELFNRIDTIPLSIPCPNTIELTDLQPQI